MDLIARSPVSHLRGLGRGRRAGRREVQPVHRRRCHLDDTGRGQRQRRRTGRGDRSVPAVGRRRPERRGRRRVLRPAPALPRRLERPSRRRRAHEFLRRHLAAGVPGRRRRGRAGRGARGSRKFTWDPEQPGQHLGGLSQYPCAGATDPCGAGSGFLGDYFGLAISQGNIYALIVSTHYGSTVTADEGGPIYYQQQVLATMPRIDFGSGYQRVWGRPASTGPTRPSRP